MDFTTLIRTRVSVRDYDPDKPISQEVLNRILEAGRLAPSAANRQPWNFQVLMSQEVLDKVRQSYSAPWFQQAPVVLAVTGKAEDAWTRSYDGYNSLETDLTIAMDHIILAAEHEGVGTCWIEAYNPEVLRSALDLHEDEQVFSITPLGYPHDGYAKPAEKKRKPLETMVTYR